jgi:hypothetical protein
LLPIGDEVAVRVNPQAIVDAPKPTPVNGRYLKVQEQVGASALAVIVAAVRPDRGVRGRVPVSGAAHRQPANMAALIGLGLLPVRMSGTPMPVTVDADASLDPASLAVALQVFDLTARQDAAGGRTVLALGSVMPNEALACTGDVGPAVRAAQQAGVDLIVVPTPCGRIDAGAVPWVGVTTLSEAINAVLERDGGG